MTTIGQGFDEFKRRLELDPAYDRIAQERHAAVRGFLENNLPGCRTQLIGSLQRRTRIDPLQGLQGFDIDILVELGEFTGFITVGGVSPDNALDNVESVVRDSAKYRRMGAHEDQPTIVIPYSDGSIAELVPAYRDSTQQYSPSGRAYWIPRKSRWVLADYDYDADYVSKVNQACKQLLIPCVKMLKSWRRHIVPKLRSYHLEAMASVTIPDVINFYQSRGSAVSWPVLLHGFFTYAVSRVQQRSSIPGSLSEPADYYLTDSERAEVANAVSASSEFAKAALDLPDSKALKMWGKLFGRPFPNA